MLEELLAVPWVTTFRTRFTKSSMASLGIVAVLIVPPAGAETAILEGT